MLNTLGGLQGFLLALQSWDSHSHLTWELPAFRDHTDGASAQGVSAVGQFSHGEPTEGLFKAFLPGLKPTWAEAASLQAASRPTSCCLHTPPACVQCICIRELPRSPAEGTCCQGAERLKAGAMV